MKHFRIKFYINEFKYLNLFKFQTYLKNLGFVGYIINPINSNKELTFSIVNYNHRELSIALKIHFYKKL